MFLLQRNPTPLMNMIIFEIVLHCKNKNDEFQIYSAISSISKITKKRHQFIVNSYVLYGNLKYLGPLYVKNEAH